MELKVLMFGELAEIAGSTEVLLDNVSSSGSALEMVENRFPEIKLKKYAVALNGKLISDNKPLSENDEMALLPPFSGG